MQNNALFRPKRTCWYPLVHLRDLCHQRRATGGQQLIRVLQLCKSHLMTLMREIDIHASPLSPTTRACCLPPEAIRHQTETATYLHWRYNAPPSVYQHNQQLSKHFQQCQFQHNINKGVWIHHSFLWAVFIWCFRENSICKSSVRFKNQKMESGKYKDKWCTNILRKSHYSGAA